MPEKQIKKGMHYAVHHHALCELCNAFGPLSNYEREEEWLDEPRKIITGARGQHEVKIRLIKGEIHLGSRITYYQNMPQPG